MKKKIIIVEDSYVVSYLVQNLISENFNAETFCTTDTNSIGTSLLEKSSLVILDHFVHSKALHEHFNGIKLAERIKRFNEEIPIILFTGCKKDQIEEIYWENVIDSYISKADPDFLQKLLLGIHKYID